MRYRRLLLLLIVALVTPIANPTAWGFIIDVNQLTEEPLVTWTTTASGTRSGNGQPAVLTWSIIPDGTRINGGSGFPNGSSDLRDFMNTRFQGDPLQDDLTQQPWFWLFQESFDRWGELSGATYIYEPADDGGVHNTGAGVLGVRGDIRIGGMSLDGSGGTLAFNFLPQAGSDMVLDTDDVSFFTNSTKDHVRFRNTVMHEHGHGFGLQHVTTTTDNLLMEPVIHVGFDGPQLDDVRGVQFFFGDSFEKSNNAAGNGSPELATDLGPIATGETASVGSDAEVTDQSIEPTAIDFVSISNEVDVDVYSFSVLEAARLDATLTPRGGTFTQAAQFRTPTSFNAAARNNLTLEILDMDGASILASSDAAGQGSTESLMGVVLSSAGEYFARVFGTDDNVQLYQLDLTVRQLLSGDYNGDGIVNAADYTVWRDMHGQSVTIGSGADGDDSGTIDVGDYEVWKLYYGEFPRVQSLLPAPEPTSGTLLVMVALFVIARCRTRSTSSGRRPCSDRQRFPRAQARCRSAQ